MVPGIARTRETADGRVEKLDTYFLTVNGKGDNLRALATIAEKVGVARPTRTATHDLNLVQLEKALLAFHAFKDDGEWHSNIEALQAMYDASPYKDEAFGLYGLQPVLTIIGQPTAK